jgi:translation initiation factor 5B
MVPDACFNR